MRVCECVYTCVGMHAFMHVFVQVCIFMSALVHSVISHMHVTMSMATY